MVTKKFKRLVQRFFAADQVPAAPRRYTRDEHNINQRFVSRHAIKVCQVLQDHGYDAFIVGGAVRDLLAGFKPKDFDVATSATPEQIRPLFRRARIIGRRFRLVHVVFGREIIETSTFRGGGKNIRHTDRHGRILRDNEFGSQEEDALRRDFTLNALYYDPLDEVIIDYHNGVEDLKNGVVRIIGDPEVRYREDPVRMMRALRFVAKLDATLEESTQAPIQTLAPLLAHVPSSRLIDELIKLLTCGNAMACLHALVDAELDRPVLPLLREVWEIDGGEAFVALALARTDARVRANQGNSPGFLLAALLWPLLRQQWKAIVDKGQHSVPALHEAADDIIGRHGDVLPIQKRLQADMRDIWFMQPRFNRRSPKAIRKMLAQPRFRAAVDFLQLRAESKEVDSVHAQWWMDLANAKEPARQTMLAELRGSTRSTRNRRRRRRSKPRSS